MRISFPVGRWVVGSALLTFDVVCAQCVQHRDPDHEVEREQETEGEAAPGQERCRVVVNAHGYMLAAEDDEISADARVPSMSRNSPARSPSAAK